MIQTLGDGNSPFIGRHGAADSSIFSPASPWEWVTLKNLREVRQWWHKMLGIILRVPTKNPSKGKRSRQSWAPVCSSMPLQHPDLKWLKGLHCHPWWSSELLLADARGGKTKGGGGEVDSWASFDLLLSPLSGAVCVDLLLATEGLKALSPLAVDLQSIPLYFRQSWHHSLLFLF